MNWLVVAGIHILEALFVIGVIGSAVVILITGVEDIETVFEREHPEGTTIVDRTQGGG